MASKKCQSVKSNIHQLNVTKIEQIQDSVQYK